MLHFTLEKHRKGFAPEPDGGAYGASTDPLTGFEIAFIYFTFVFAMNLVGISSEISSASNYVFHLPPIHFCPKPLAKTSVLFLDHTVNIVPPSPFPPPIKIPGYASALSSFCDVLLTC